CLEGDRFSLGLAELSGVSPGPLMSAWQPMYDALLRRGIDRGLRNVMVGTGGDEFFYVNLGYAADCVARLQPLALWAFCRALQRSWGDSATAVARYAIWEAVIKSEVRGLARRALCATWPSIRDRIVVRRSRRARPSWLAPTD